MNSNRMITIVARAACVSLFAAHMGLAFAQSAAQIEMTPATMPRVGAVDPRFLSYNVEMAEVVGGNFWKPYTAMPPAGTAAQALAASSSDATVPPVAGQDKTMFQARAPLDLTNARLRKLASALGPAYMRTSGTWANTAYFDDSAAPGSAPTPKGFQGTLTTTEWKNVVDFAHAVDAKLVTSFAISSGVRDASGTWTPDQARKLVAYTRTIGGQIAAAEFFNEPDMPTYGGAPAGYTAADYARDFAIFRRFAKSAAPDMDIVGPGSVGEDIQMPLMNGHGIAAGAVKTEDMMIAAPRPVFDIFSFHFYGAVSKRCASMGAAAQTTPEDALSQAWFARADISYDFYVKGLRDHHAPGKPVWITETADSACGGNPWAIAFLDNFRFLDQIGRFARHGVAVVFHNTLASSEYGLLDPDTFAPRPKYWAALLWHRLMGPTVLNAGPSRPGLSVYAHCLAGQTGGVTVLAINYSKTKPATLQVPFSAQRYTLSASNLLDTNVRLNDRVLKLGIDDSLPPLTGRAVPAGPTVLAPETITFLTVRDAGNMACR